MTVTVTSYAYVEGHPNIRPAPRVERCGASAQHAASPHDPAYSDRCTDPGEWALKGCARQYCTTHAAVIGRAKDRLWGGTNWCASRRDTAEPTSLWGWGAW